MRPGIPIAGIGCLLAFASVCFAADKPAPKNAAPRGEQLFNAHCAICHSIGGTGGRGPDLTMQPLRRVTNNGDLVKIIREGIEGTEMPSTWMMNVTEARTVAEYVRSLAQPTAAPIPGDPKRGADIYAGADCSQCHIVAGAGRGLGPELTMIGARRNAEYLRRALGRPDADVAESYAMMQIETADGKRIEGLRINEDSFTIQLRDMEGTLYSVRKSDLKSYRLLRGKTLMPEYAAKFSPAELDDLVAYLVSLKGVAK